MEWASVIGLALALAGILLGRTLDGGALSALLQPAAFVIVVFGTCGAVLLQSGTQNFLRGLRMARWVVHPPKEDLEALAMEIHRWSVTARREGLLSLERQLQDVNDPFIGKAIRLVVDGIEPHRMREILDGEISSFERQERQAVKIWEAAGGYAPTIGIIGAVLGLIHVMEHLTEPSKLGSGIAVAFVATIYGVGLANLVFLPIANKLKGIIASQIARLEMMADVFYSIASGDNGRVIQERILAYR
jgi:chemotaxis protein MotA